MEMTPTDIPGEYLASFRVREYHVDLTLEHLHSFSGRVRIFADVSGPPRNLFYLHSTGLKISHATVGGVSATVADELSLTRATRFELPVAITGTTVMEVEFAGLISTRAPEGLSILGPNVDRRRRMMVGLDGRANIAGAQSRTHKSSFPLGTVLGTHLEPTHARDLFPCIDLPSCKAVFHLTLRGVPAHLQAISNAQILRVEDYRRPHREGERLGPHQCQGQEDADREEPSLPLPHKEESLEELKTVVFYPTPVMPTYILGFWVGDFSSLSAQAFESESDRSTPLTCCGTPVSPMPPPAPGEDPTTISVHVLQGAKETSARFALDFAKRAFELFSRLFSVRFPLPKLDLLGLPSMHGLGMENFGAITLLEDYMLVTRQTSFVRRRRIARLICHEVCHQWYGDIVTPESFDELWLKEGLARFFEYVAVEALDSSYGVWSNFMSEVFFQAMLADAQKKSHPVVQQHNGNIASILDSFDTITYCKGASVLRMLCHCVGPARFLEGTRRCVVEHQFASATQEDLWRAVQAVCDRDSVAIDVLDLMRPWLTRERFPLLRVRMTGDTELTLTQRPFSFYELSERGDPSETEARDLESDRQGRAQGRVSGSTAETTPSAMSKDPSTLGGTPGAPDDDTDAYEADTDGEATSLAPGPGRGTPSKPREKDVTMRWVIPLRIRVGDGSKPRVVRRGDGSAGEASPGARVVDSERRRHGVESVRTGEEAVHTDEVVKSLMMAGESVSVSLGSGPHPCGEGDPWRDSASPLPRREGSGESGAEEEEAFRATGVMETAGARDSSGRGSPYLIVNDGHSGFFTVQYECERSWSLAIAALEGGFMTDCEAMGFVHDLILGLHEGVLLDRDAKSGGQDSTQQHHCDVPRLFARLQDVVRLLGRDRSHPAWCPGQLFVWELLLICASNALVEMEETSPRQRADSPAATVAAGGGGTTRGGACEQLSSDGAAPEVSGETRASGADEQTKSVRDGSRGHRQDNRAPNGPGETSVPATGARKAQRQEGGTVGDAGGAAPPHHGGGKRAAERAARVRLFRIVTDVELAVREVEEHVRWHADRVAMGNEQAAESWQSLVAMRTRMGRMLQRCQARLCLGGGFGGWAAAAAAAAAASGVGSERGDLATSPISMLR